VPKGLAQKALEAYTLGMPKTKHAPKSFKEVISLWPTRVAFARSIGVEYVNAQMMDKRNSIHARHWQAVSRAAAKIGHPEITIECLADVAERRKNPPRRKVAA
jgi:hypothetical protein